MLPVIVPESLAHCSLAGFLAKSEGAAGRAGPPKSGERACVSLTAPPAPMETSAVGMQTEAGCFKRPELGEKGL